MAASNTINLIRTTGSESPQVDAIGSSLRRTGYIGLVLFISAGLLVAILYILFSAEDRSLEAQRQDYIRQIDKYRQIEGYFRSIKERTTIVQKTFSSKKPWAKLLDQINLFATPPTLTSVSVDDDNHIIVTVTTNSLDSIMPIVNGIIVQAKEKRLLKPQMTTLQITMKGEVSASFSFTAVF